MQRCQRAGFRISLEKREIVNDHELMTVRGYQFQQRCRVLPHAIQRGTRYAIGGRCKECEITISKPQTLGSTLFHKPGQRTFQCVTHALEAKQACRTHLPGTCFEFVNLLSTERSAAGQHQPAYATARCNGRLRYTKIAVGKFGRSVEDTHVEAQVRTIRSVKLHGRSVRQAADPRGNNSTSYLPQLPDESLGNGKHILAIHERCLNVNLGELRLTVCAEVFITKAPRNLEVAVVTAH